MRCQAWLPLQPRRIQAMALCALYVQLQSHGTNWGSQQQVTCPISFPVENHIILCLGFLYVGFPWKLVIFRTAFWKSSGRSSEDLKPTLFPVLPSRAHEFSLIGYKTPTTTVPWAFAQLLSVVQGFSGGLFSHSPLSQGIIPELFHLDL